MDKKKLVVTLFMNVKSVFDHVVKTQLIVQILKLKINKDLICEIRSFFINQKLQFIINNYYNQKKEIKIRILYKLLVSLILFLIYINNVFEQVEKKLFEIISLLFVNNLGFITLKVSVKEMAKTLEKVGRQFLSKKRKRM